MARHIARKIAAAAHSIASDGYVTVSSQPRGKLLWSRRFDGELWLTVQQTANAARAVNGNETRRGLIHI